MSALGGVKEKGKGRAMDLDDDEPVILPYVAPHVIIGVASHKFYPDPPRCERPGQPVSILRIHDANADLISLQRISQPVARCQRLGQDRHLFSVR